MMAGPAERELQEIARGYYECRGEGWTDRMFYEMLIALARRVDRGEGDILMVEEVLN